MVMVAQLRSVPGASAAIAAARRLRPKDRRRQAVAGLAALVLFALRRRK